MIKKILLIQCDICGKVKKLTVYNKHNKEKIVLPEKWKWAIIGDKDIHICPLCFAHL